MDIPYYVAVLESQALGIGYLSGAVGVVRRIA